MKIKDLEMNKAQTIKLLLLSADEKTTRSGSPYCTLSFTDGEATISANRWDTKGSDVEKYIDKVLIATIKPEIYNGQTSYVVSSMIRTDDPISDYVATVPEEIPKMWDDLILLITKHRASSLSDFVIEVLEGEKDKYLYWSAARSMHHNIYGGLIYHSYRMAKTADMLAEIYPMLDSELLVCAAVVHDIGKLRELHTTATGAADYTLEGELLAHAIIGIEMLSEKAAGKEVEKLTLLKHIIASHHGRPEWGAAVTAKIPEAVVLHYLDMIDSRIYMFEEEYKNLEPGDMSTNKVRGLDNVHVLRTI